MESSNISHAICFRITVGEIVSLEILNKGYTKSSFVVVYKV